MTLHDVSVIVPTRDEFRHVAAFVGSLHPDVELIVVDASADATAELFEELRPRRTRVVRCGARLARARQIGAGLARGRWLLFSDADVRFDAGYFEALAGGVESDAFYGPKRATAGHARYGRAFCAAQRALHRLGVPAASGSNMAVRREVFEAVGGIREDLPVNEDTELMMRIAHEGYRVEWRADLAVTSIDDRRLDDGLVLKSAHSLARGLLIWLGLRTRVPARWLAHDWGYWRMRPRTRS